MLKKLVFLGFFTPNLAKLSFFSPVFASKAELPKLGGFFALNFLPREFLLVKKLDFEKTKTTSYTTFKTDIIKVVLVLLISNFFTNKNSQGRKLSAV